MLIVVHLLRSMQSLILFYPITLMFPYFCFEILVRNDLIGCIIYLMHIKFIKCLIIWSKKKKQNNWMLQRISMDILLDFIIVRKLFEATSINQHISCLIAFSLLIVLWVPIIISSQFWFLLILNKSHDWFQPILNILKM